MPCFPGPRFARPFLSVVALVSLSLALPSGAPFAGTLRSRSEARSLFRPDGTGRPFVTMGEGTTAAANLLADDRLRSGLAGGLRGLSAASADFDEDGALDVAVGASGPGGDLVTIWIGNPDFQRPSSAGAKRRRAEGTSSATPFREETRSLETTLPPALLIAGDFDLDSHADVVAGSVGLDRLELLAGDGTGRLARRGAMALPGGLTALAVGDVNGRDGLDDILVVVDGAAGPELLVFESAEGAFAATPERIPLAAPATGIVTGELDGRPGIDIAALCGGEVVLVSGRDRRIYADPSMRGGVEEPSVGRIPLPMRGTSLAAGDFAWELPHRNELAVLLDDGTVRLVGAAAAGAAGRDEPLELRPGGWRLPAASRLVRARLSNAPVDTLVGVRVDGSAVDLLPGDASGWSDHLAKGGQLAPSFAPADRAIPLALSEPAAAVLPVLLNADALTDLVVVPASGDPSPAAIPTLPQATFTVNNAAASGAGSLRQAILNANATAGTDYITFAIPAAGIPVINPYSAGSGLPTVTEGVTIDGTAQSAGLVELDGSSFPAGSTVNGFTIASGNVALYGFVVNDFKAAGVELTINGSNFVRSGYFGTTSTGSVASGNLYGVETFNFGTATIGGIGVGDGNLISGNTSHGVHLQGDPSAVQGNQIGTNLAGTGDLGNGAAGVYIHGGSNTVGGTLSTAKNVISGNYRGVEIDGGSGNLVQGNWIGTNGAGSGALGNSYEGVLVTYPGAGVTVGSTSSGGRNVISANQNGVHVSGAYGNTILGNYIGTGSGGATDLGNTLDGVYLEGGGNNQVGGTASGSRNVISGNNDDGISVVYPAGSATSANSVIQGNYIGLTATGSAALPNLDSGIFLYAGSTHLVGGTTSSARNVISGNGGDGVEIGGHATSVTISANFVGLDPTGATDLGNSGAGVSILDCGTCRIGGTTSAERNVISGNSLQGVVVSGSATNGVTIEGNTIGLDATGAIDRGNTLDGVLVSGTPTNVKIGDSVAGGGNVISGNGGDGIEVNGNGGTSVLQNTIGLDIGGTLDRGNDGNGVLVTGSSGGSIGSSCATCRNVIGGNTGAGVRIGGGSSAISVVNNRLGTNAAGTAAVGNFYGVLIQGATNCQVGSTSSNNVISGNGLWGVYLTGAGTTGNVVFGNYIGLDEGGAAIPNASHGIFVENTGANTIGGTTSGKANAISGNGGDGIYAYGTTGLVINGNSIGLAMYGDSVHGNAADGIDLFACTNTTISTPTTGPRILVSGNGGNGILIRGGSTGTTVGNAYVGSLFNGITAAPNALAGISVSDASSSSIGGASATLMNLVSGNTGPGIEILTVSGTATGNVVKGNVIGRAWDGAGALPNGGAGVRISGNASNNTIGGTAAGEANVIAGNGGDGIEVGGGSGNSLRGNSMVSNGGLGIDLLPDGITPNDAGDGDSGPNLLQNFPVINGATYDGSNTILDVTLSSTPSSTFTIDVYANDFLDLSGAGEGKSWKGSGTVVTNASGLASNVLVAVPGSVQLPTVTATSSTGNTSEFSAAFLSAQPTEAGKNNSFRVRKGAGTSIATTWNGSCYSTNHAVYWGTGPISGAPGWSGSACSLGTSGSATFDPGGAGAGGLLYFVIVGYDGTREGPYGADSNGNEPPEATGVGACDLPRSVQGYC